MRKIALVNQKGGVGKTTTAVNLSAALARLGAKVMVIDLDPQSNTTTHFGVHPHECESTIYSVMSSQATPQDVMIEARPGLYLIPSSIDLAGTEMELAGKIGRERVLSDAMSTITDFDFILVDCPPSLGLLNINGLTFVNEVFIPLQCEFFALQGISLLLRTVDLVKKRLNPNLDITGVIACMLDLRRTLSRETLEEIEKYFGTKVYKTRIRTNVRLAEAPSHGKTIFDYDLESNGARDYLALAREVLGLPPVVFEPLPDRKDEEAQESSVLTMPESDTISPAEPVPLDSIEEPIPKPLPESDAPAS